MQLVTDQNQIIELKDNIHYFQIYMIKMDKELEGHCKVFIKGCMGEKISFRCYYDLVKYFKSGYKHGELVDIKILAQ